MIRCGRESGGPVGFVIVREKRTRIGVSLMRVHRRGGGLCLGGGNFSRDAQLQQVTSSSMLG